jgi:cellulose synthase/poly-beta-1,6-N-acetylglucosamine synthase-like glycosyltransferase
MNSLMLIVFLFGSFLVIYHHIIYPILLVKFATNVHDKLPVIHSRSYLSDNRDNYLPKISIVMPAYNEANFIAEKIHNLSTLDYPMDKLQIVISCDGCTDQTLQIAEQTILKIECSELNVVIIDNAKNRGKLKVLNEAIQFASGEIIVLTDVSALLPINSLLMVATNLNDKDNGAVSGSYKIINPGSKGEKSYWNYQTKVKHRESKLSSVLGCHGSFYGFRKALFSPLPEHTINDDFILPMMIAAQKKRVIYDSRVSAIELESSNPKQDFSRRKRIGAGNMQQLIFMWRLLLPDYGWLSFNFASGKALRAMMPFILLALLLSSAYLMIETPLFVIIFSLQSCLYLTVIFLIFTGINIKHTIIKWIDYFVVGYWAALVGSCRYLLGMDKGSWNRS